MSVTIILIILTVIASLYAWNNQDIYQKWIFNPYRIVQKHEYYRFLTSGFMHGDYGHLFFNMFSLYLIGGPLENYFEAVLGTKGILLYVAMYILGIIISDLPTFFKHKNNPHYNSIGASGGVSSVVFSLIVIAPTITFRLFFAIPITAFIFGALYLIFSYYQARGGRDNINHDAHLYGAIFGIIFTIIFIPDAISNFIYQISNWQIF